MVAATEGVACRNDVDVGALRTSLLHTMRNSYSSSKNTITLYPCMARTWQTGETNVQRLFVFQASNNLLTGVAGAKCQRMI